MRVLMPIISTDPPWYVLILKNFFEWLDLVFPQIPSLTWKIILLVILFSFIRTFRNLLLLIEKLFIGILRHIPGSKELIKRYLALGRYSFYLEQTDLLSKLRSQ